MRYLNNHRLVATVFSLLVVAAPLIAEEKPKTDTKAAQSKGRLVDLGVLGGKSDDAPTFVDADSLTLYSEKRLFIYKGNVSVRHNDMTMTCEKMEGTYAENNQLQTITAYTNVTVIKPTGLKATGQKAFYDAAADTMLLTENPAIEQNGSNLTADQIKIYLKDNRSEATGQVRVKLVKKTETEKEAAKKAVASATPSAAPSLTAKK